jgi:hypothetical protein
LPNLKTNLKDLKFGNDRIYGGSSNQPYIQTPIPDQVEDRALSYDFILRGGVNAVQDSLIDVKRLGKYFIDLKSPSGLLFVVKQNLLSRTAVRTQSSTGILNEGIYTPLSTLAQAGGVAFGLHVNKQGLNPFDGLGGINTYSDVIKDKILPKDTNRLIKLTDSKINTNILSEVDIESYPGGPGSILGIGKTYINFATDNIGSPLRVTNAIQNINNVLNYSQLPDISDETYTQNSSYNGTQIVDFRKKLKQDLNKTIFSSAPSYDSGKNKIIEQRVNLGDPGNPSGKDLSSYTQGVGPNSSSIYYGAASQNSYDKINASVLYQSEGPQGTNNPNPDAVNNDLVKFRIGVINNDTPTLKTYIHFRAFLDQISDDYNATWNSSKYIGRGENFYTYGGFDRKVSLSWTVAAQSKAELIPMYKRLNYLASVCAPDYSSFGYMRGNIVTLTIGGYLYEQPGIITGLNYTMNDENSSWEIGIDDEGASDTSVKELPHLIKVTGFNFIPIHQFVPRLQQNIYNSTSDGEIGIYGPERYIALNAGSNSNYNN